MYLLTVGLANIAGKHPGDKTLFYYWWNMHQASVMWMEAACIPTEAETVSHAAEGWPAKSCPGLKADPLGTNLRHWSSTCHTGRCWMWGCTPLCCSQHRWSWGGSGESPHAHLWTRTCKRKQRSSTCSSVIRDFIKSHPRPFHAVQNLLLLTHP